MKDIVAKACQEWLVGVESPGHYLAIVEDTLEIKSCSKLILFLNWGSALWGHLIRKPLAARPKHRYAIRRPYQTECFHGLFAKWPAKPWGELDRHSLRGPGPHLAFLSLSPLSWAKHRGHSSLALCHRMGSRIVTSIRWTTGKLVAQDSKPQLTCH